MRFSKGTFVTSGSRVEEGKCVIYPRNIRDQGDVKVEKDIVTFNEEEDGDILVEEVPQIERGTVFFRDTYREARGILVQKHS